MNRLLIPALSALLLVTPATRAADDDAKAVIAKAIKAHGGEDVLVKLKAGTSTNKGKIDFPGVGEVDFTQQVMYMLPDKLKEEVEISVNGQNVKIVTVANGDTVSIEAAGNKVDVTDDMKAQLKGMQYMMKVSRLVSLVKEKDYELSLIGEVKVEDKPAVGVRVTNKGQKDVSLFFDKQTNLLVKIEHRTTQPGGGNEITEERIILEYKKDKDGIQMPKKVLIKHDGKKFAEAEVVEGGLLEKIDDGEFKK